MHLPSLADRKEPIPGEDGWFVLFNNGTTMFATTHPMSWAPSIICRVRWMKAMKRPILSQPILGDAEGFTQ
jgi:hypothetical protein